MPENDLAEPLIQVKKVSLRPFTFDLFAGGWHSTPWQLQQWFRDANTCLPNLPIQAAHSSLAAHRKRALTTKVSNRLSLGTKITIASPVQSLCTCKSSINISCFILFHPTIKFRYLFYTTKRNWTFNYTAP